MTTSWKVFACVLAVAIIAAIVMGNSSQNHGSASLTSAGGKGVPKEQTVPFPAPPENSPLGKSAPPGTGSVPPSNAQGPAPTTSPSTASAPVPSTYTPAPSASSSSASAASSSSVSSHPSTPSTLSSDIDRSSTAVNESQTDQTVTDGDASQSTAPTETASQRVGRKLRGH